MKIWSWLKRVFDPYEMKGAKWSVWDDRWYTPFLAQETKAGARVDEQSAMSISGVWACVKIIAEDIASLPLHLYQRQDRARKKAERHPLYYLLQNQPNPEMDAMTFRETMTAHLLTWGNCYAEKEVMAGTGRVKALWPIPPHLVTAYRDSQTGQIYYEVRVENTGETRVIRREYMFHCKGLSGNGVIGYSPITKLREAIGLAAATEEFGARFFGAGTHPGIIVSHPDRISPNAAENLKRSLMEKFSGLGKTHRLLLLEEGMNWEKVGIPPNDAQFLETRKFQLSEIARIYRMPLHMMAEMDRATHSNIEQQSLEYVVYTLRPWLVRFEQAYNNQLLGAGLEWRRYFWKHTVEGLLRGDIKSRYEAYATGRQWGWLSANDVRELEDMNAVDGGDTYLMPLNMGPIGPDGQVVTPEPEPVQEPEMPEEEQPNQGNGNNNTLENRCWSCDRLLYLGKGTVEIKCKCGALNLFAEEVNYGVLHG